MKHFQPAGTIKCCVAASCISNEVWCEGEGHRTSGCIAGDVTACCQVLQRAKKNVEAGEDQDEFRANGKV